MSKKENTQALRGMLDYPPKDMEVRTYLRHGIELTAEKFGFKEYDLPIIEALDTFSHKTSSEILQQQAYSFEDKGGRKVLLRPEITPSLARMAAGQAKAYKRPFRWYIIGACYRYERPQKGRLREFHQLNFDILGESSVLYDVEILQLIAELFTAYGIAPHAYQIRYNHRGFAQVALRMLAKMDGAKQSIFFQMVDKKNKLSVQAFEELCHKNFSDEATRDFIKSYLEKTSVSAVTELLETLRKLLSQQLLATKPENAAIENFIKQVENFSQLRKLLGLVDFPSKPIYDPSIVRGFDYYTGLVFEVFDASGEITRSLFGGGRYDLLLAGYLPKQGDLKNGLTGVGFGMGLHIVRLFLEKLGLPLRKKIDTDGKAYLAMMVDRTNTNAKTEASSEEVLALQSFAFKVAACLRNKGYAVEIGAAASSLQKLFTQAKSRGYTLVSILGERELATKAFSLKNIASGEVKNFSLLADAKRK